MAQFTDPVNSSKFTIDTTAERSISSAGASLVGGQANMKFSVGAGAGASRATDTAPLSSSDLTDLISRWLGTTADASNNGRLQRQLPIAHPVYFNWVANQISNIAGVGVPIAIEGSNPLANNPVPFDRFELFPTYEFVVQFGPRDYPMFSDDILSVRNFDVWYPRSNNNQQIPYFYSQEFYRYTDFTEVPQDNSVTGRQGQMEFITPGLNGKTTNGIPWPAANVPFPDMPRQFLPDSIVKFQWYQVPWRYVTSPKSYLKRLKGTINQNVFPCDSSQPPWQPGELLYLSYNAKKYTIPPINAAESPTSVYGYLGNQNFLTYNKLCDIELIFLSTKRIYPNQNETRPVPNNKNAVVGGHNLMAATSVDRFFHYAQTAPGNPPIVVNGSPFWWSTPHELLFMDPDFVQPDGFYDASGNMIM